MGTDLKALTRETQATRLWDIGLARTLGFCSFEHYLASIPSVPDWPAELGHYFQDVVLVDSRSPIWDSCAAGGVNYADVMGENLVHNMGVYWLFCQLDARYRGQAMIAFAPFQRPLLAHEGVAAFLQYPHVLNGINLELRGTSSRHARNLILILAGVPIPHLTIMRVGNHACGTVTCWNGQPLK